MPVTQILSVVGRSAGGSGVGSYVSYRYNSSTNSITSISNVLGMAGGITTLYEGNADDENINFSVPWTVTFDGATYSNNLFVGSNSYLTFGQGSNQYSGLGASSPNIPKIMISSADNSYQRVYTIDSGSTPNRLFRIRYEGTNSTCGTLDSPNIVWEIEFNETTPAVFDIHIGANARGTDGVSGIYSASALLASLY